MKIFKTYVFQWWEIGLIKICLLSLGILLGLYFYNFLINFLWFWWILFVIFAIYFIIRFLHGK